MILSKREKLLLSLLLFVIVLSVYLYKFIFPLIDQISEKQGVLESESALLDQVKLLSKDTTLNSSLKDLEEELDQLEQILPTSAQISELYLDIVEISNRCGIDNQDIQFSEPEEFNAFNDENQNDTLYYFTVLHDFTGNYDQLSNYITEVQQNRRKLDVVDYKISSVEGSSEKLSASFTLRFYSLEE